MQIIDISIESLSRDVAQCNAVILKSNDQFRYLFLPKLIDNSQDKSKCISGQFIVQKKKKTDVWENYNALPINKLVAGQWINLDLSTSSLDTFISYIETLKKIYKEEGKHSAFNSVHTVIFSSKITKDEKELITEMFNKNVDFKNELRKIINANISIDDVINAIEKKEVEILQITDKLNNEDSIEMYNILKAKLINPNYLEQNLINTDEKFWQELFQEQPNILSAVIPTMGQIIEDQPYMGGKAINNSGSSVGDFIYKCGSRNISIIEIKTPSTKLIGKKYRTNSYSISDELSGALVQIRQQKDSFMKEYNSIKMASMKKGIDFDSYDPKSFIIVGKTSDLDENELESFELFRNSLKDVEIITFDELIEKIKLIQEYIITGK